MPPTRETAVNDDDVPVRYARSGRVHIAYITEGEGPEDILVVPAVTSNVEMQRSISPLRASQLRRGSLGRITWFDKRGTGLSDRDARFTFDERMDDLRAVMDAAGIERAHLVGSSEGGALSILFAATYPSRAKSLVLAGSFASWRRQPDHPAGRDMSLEDFSDFLDQIEAGYEGDAEALHWLVNLFAPSAVGNPEAMQWWSRFLHQGASPGDARKVWGGLWEIDVRRILLALRLPTAVLHVTGDQLVPVEGARYLASHIAGARLREFPGTDHMGLPPDAFYEALRENIELAKGWDPLEGRELATLLYTDFVDSTPATAREGDRAWRQLMDEHDRLAREALARHRGELVKFHGDGLLATFDGPGRAIACAQVLVAGCQSLGVRLRAGLHCGEIERRDGDITGIAVNAVARICDACGPSEVLVSRTVKDLVAGAQFSFEERDTTALKGLEGEWQLYTLVQ
jgi:class 3 adenylate cyclase/pimeloyl-ACP methyl ester carboxylesterase